MIASPTVICFTIGVSILFFRLLLHFLHSLTTYTQLVWPTRLVHSLLLVHDRRFDYHNWISVSLIQFTWRLLFVLALLDLIRISFPLPNVFERALDYQYLVPFIFFYNWYLHNLCVALWVLWLFSLSYFLGSRIMMSIYPLCFILAFSCSSTWIITLVEVLLIVALLSCQAHLDKALWHQGVVRVLPDCSNLDQHIYVLGLRPWQLVLPFYGYWPFLFMIQICILRSELPSRAIVSCAYLSLLLSVVTFMALVRCVQKHVCHVHVFAGSRAISQVQKLRKKGRLLLSMWRFFLRQVIRHQFLMVTILTDFECNVAILMYAREGTVRILSGPCFCLVHKVFWHNKLIICCLTRIVIWIGLYKVTDITTGKCSIWLLWVKTRRRV